MTVSRTTWAKLACLYSGAIWGVYWIPLRAMEAEGLSGVWATVLFFGLSLTLLLPAVVWRLGKLARGGLAMHFGALAASVAFVSYANALIYTEVIRTMVLFYLTPVWGFLLARFFLGEPITLVRVDFVTLWGCRPGHHVRGRDRDSMAAQRRRLDGADGRRDVGHCGNDDPHEPARALAGVQPRHILLGHRDRVRLQRHGNRQHVRGPLGRCRPQSAALAFAVPGFSRPYPALRPRYSVQRCSIPVSSGCCS